MKTKCRIVSLKVVLLFLFSAGLFQCIQAQFYTGSHTNFGRKRVQFEEFFWMYYRFERFDVYFNRNGKNLSQYTASYAQHHLEELEKKIGVFSEDKFQFIIFNRLTDYKQTNIGYVEEESYVTGGVTKILGSKIFLFFDGDYVDFERQIRSGISEILINQAIYGQSLTAQVRNSARVELPDWFLFGATSYLANQWDEVLDDQVRDGFSYGAYKYILTLEGEDARVAGHAFFYFLSQKYGDQSISSLLQNMAVYKEIESAFSHTYNRPFNDLIKDMKAFYTEGKTHDTVRQIPDKKQSLKRLKQKDRKYSQFLQNPDGQHVAYVSNELGKARIYIRDLKKKRGKKIYQIGYSINDHPDYTYPMIAWHPAGEILAVAGEEKGVTVLLLYDMTTRKYEKLNMENFDKILGFSYAPNGRMIALSAVKQGQSDIFLYNMGTNVATQITNDMYDDAHPRFFGNTKIVFSSNRPNDSLKINNKFSEAPSFSANHQIFMYDLQKSDNPFLFNTTNNPEVDFRYPMQYSDNKISFLNNENGIYNRSIAILDSVIETVDTTIHYTQTSEWHTVTNSVRNIQEQDINRKTGKIADILHLKNRYLLNLKNIDDTDKAVDNSLTRYRKSKNAQTSAKKEAQRQLEEQKKADSIGEKAQPKKSKKKLRQARLSDASDDFIKVQTALSTDSVRVPQPPKLRNYEVEYTVNEATTQLNFSFLNESYQTYSGGGSPIYLNPGATGLFKIGMSDLMENHRIVAGMRLSLDFSNTEYLLSYENLTHRLGRQIIVHRQSINETSSYTAIRQRSYNAYYVLKYPFSEVLLLKGTAIGRYNHTFYRATDRITIDADDLSEYWAGLKGELIYDHSRLLTQNIPLGTRTKFFAEYYQNITKNSESMFVLGVDFRNYQRIWKTFIWANRFAASTSFGPSKLIYYMGGVDDWMFPKFNRDIQIDQTQNYAYQTLATNMRGFTQNIRNGNSFIAINSELRFPIFSCLSPKPIEKPFFKHFQVVGFLDAGTAWVGWNPWSKENAYYKRVVDEDPFTITIEKNLEPFVAGVGWGLRSQLFGYFIRADWAYGIENEKIGSMIFYLSLSLDF